LHFIETSFFNLAVLRFRFTHGTINTEIHMKVI
jgi:hypothetical protein